MYFFCAIFFLGGFVLQNYFDYSTGSKSNLFDNFYTVVFVWLYIKWKLHCRYIYNIQQQMSTEWGYYRVREARWLIDAYKVLTSSISTSMMIVKLVT